MSRPKIVIRVLIVWLLVKIVGCGLGVPKGWGPEIGGNLSNGTRLYFHSRQVGRESDEELVVARADGGARVLD